MIDRYVEWVISIKFVKKRMSKPSLFVCYRDVHKGFGSLVVSATASYF